MLPWSIPEHDVVADIRNFLQQAREDWPPAPFEPMLPQSLVMHREDRMDRTYDSVAIVSGGLDSTTLLYDMIDKGYTPHVLSFNYGQRHKKELQYATLTARTLNLRHDIVDLTNLTHLISNSALTSQDRLTEAEAQSAAHSMLPGESMSWPLTQIDVPEGHYAEDTMKATVVPNRNMIMLSIAAGVAVNNKYQVIGVGVHAGDHFIYPDCRPEFLNTLGEAIVMGNDGFHSFTNTRRIVQPMGAWDALDPFYAPFINKSKADIAYRALELGVPLHSTWSCYKGGENHCGKCGTCVERLEAINEALHKLGDLNNAEYERLVFKHNLHAGGHWDQTEYDDTEFWRTAVKG